MNRRKFLSVGGPGSCLALAGCVKSVGEAVQNATDGQEDEGRTSSGGNGLDGAGSGVNLTRDDGGFDDDPVVADADEVGPNSSNSDGIDLEEINQDSNDDSGQIDVEDIEWDSNDDSSELDLEEINRDSDDETDRIDVDDVEWDSNDDAEETSTPPQTANEIEVSATDFRGDSYISSYSSRGLEVEIDPEDPTLDGTSLRTMEVRAVATTYPRETIVARASDGAALGSGGKQSVSLSVDLGDAPIGEPLQYLTFLVPRGESIRTASASEIVQLHESDPFELHSDGATIQSTTVPELMNLYDDSGQHHSRTSKEGVVDLSFEGRTNGRNWSVNFYTFKSAYVNAARRDRGRSYSNVVSYEIQRGFGWEIAELLKEEAVANGFTGKRMQVEFLIDFVQHLPYVPDDVSTGYDDYTKYTMETLSECGGDCEDSAILLASVLSSEAFGYDTILLQPPGHMAVGIKGEDDLPGYYWEYDGNKYYYIETTGVGWDVGDLPNEYRDSEARIHPV